MSGVSEAVLFEAVMAPRVGLSARGLRWLCGLAAATAALPAAFFAVLGAWPVLPFIGAELLLVIGLLLLHRRWSRAARETVTLIGGRLLIRREDGRGGRESSDLEAFWARLELRERDGTVPLLLAHARGHSAEVGRFLSAEEKRGLAAALEEALRRYRAPRFDNPQLRG